MRIRINIQSIQFDVSYYVEKTCCTSNDVQQHRIFNGIRQNFRITDFQSTYFSKNIFSNHILVCEVTRVRLYCEENIFR